MFESVVNPDDPYPWPPSPAGPFDRASDVPDTVTVRGYSKSHWRFAAGDELFDAGAQILLSVHWRDGLAAELGCDPPPPFWARFDPVRGWVREAAA